MADRAMLRNVNQNAPGPGFPRRALEGLFPVEGPTSDGERLAAAIEHIADQTVAAVRGGANLVILSDRNTSASHAAIPSLLLVSAVHHRLVDEHLRTRAALILEAGDVREVHHVALLVGFGASAVCPYLAYETIDALVDRGDIDQRTAFEARYQYAKALTKGLVKVMSKMGVSTVASYVGSQLFESVGLDETLLANYFPEFASRVGGTGIERIAKDLLTWHRAAYATEPATEALANTGEYQWRRDGELHLFNPHTVQKLQHATREGRYDLFKEYTTLVDDQRRGRMTLRSLLELRPAPTPTPLDEVESVSSIVRRFSTGAMSYGSISEEAHSTLAIAMNRLGAKSNTGEGGEDEDRFDTSDPRQNRRSAIKQVAAGRLGGGPP
jgi:glutamate synthase (NADPH/NADH) large chain